MPLHPQAARFLEQLAALNLPPTERCTPEEVRRIASAANASMGPPEPMEDIENRRIPGPAGPIPIRIYRPPALAPAAPGIVFFHGGGWVAGDLETHDALCRALAKAARAVLVAVDYRLAPEHRYPAAVDDAYAATLRVRDHAADLGIDPQRLAVAGDSAGGNLAAVVALMLRDRGQPNVAAQILLYPATDYNLDTSSYRDCAEGYMLTRAAMDWYYRQYFDHGCRADEPYACPARARDLRGLPPALVITAEYDPLRDEAEIYAQKLQAAGVPAPFARYEGQIHGFMRRINTFDAARQAVREVASFLEHTFGSPGRQSQVAVRTH